MRRCEVNVINHQQNPAALGAGAVASGARFSPQYVRNSLQSTNVRISMIGIISHVTALVCFEDRKCEKGSLMSEISERGDQ